MNITNLLIAGVDEAGRGCLAGPVCAGAVILDPEYIIPGLGDSKTISPQRRSLLYGQICAHARSWAIGWASVEEIERLNILHASMLAMQRAVDNLSVRPELVLVDGNRCPQLDVPAQAIIGGDASETVIGAASILAKVARDRYMVKLDQAYPGYGFMRHKGYPTAEHVAALQTLGVAACHRRAYAPVRRVLAKISLAS